MRGWIFGFATVLALTSAPALACDADCRHELEIERLRMRADQVRRDTFLQIDRLMQPTTADRMVIQGMPSPYETGRYAAAPIGRARGGYGGYRGGYYND